MVAAKKVWDDQLRLKAHIAVECIYAVYWMQPYRSGSCWLPCCTRCIGNHVSVRPLLTSVKAKLPALLIRVKSNVLPANAADWLSRVHRSWANSRC